MSSDFYENKILSRYQGTQVKVKFIYLPPQPFNCTKFV